MIATGLPIEDVAEVRRRTLHWASQNQISYPEIARRTHLSLDQVKRFLAGSTGPLATDQAAACCATYLPINLRYVQQRVVPG